MAALDNVVMVGPLGWTGGTCWQHELRDVNARSIKIIIRFGAMGINYIDVKSVEKRDNIEHHPERSGAGVGDTIVIILGPDELIKDYTFGFSEPDAKYLSWLRFVTNTDKIYGPYGTVTTSEFSLRVPKGKLVGFFGWNELNEGPISSVGVELADSDNKVMVGPWGLSDVPLRKPEVPDGHARDTRIIIIYDAGGINYVNVESAENRDNIKNHTERSGAGVEKIAMITLGPDEYIKDYSLYFDPNANCLSALGFTTNKNMHGPYGTVTTSGFILPVTKGKLVGFFVNNEVPIKSIGFVFAP